MFNILYLFKHNKLINFIVSTYAIFLQIVSLNLLNPSPPKKKKVLLDIRLLRSNSIKKWVLAEEEVVELH
jgi:hypothetical protein